MAILYALFVQDVSQSLQSYVAAINSALVALGPIGVQDVNVTRLENGPGKRGRLRTTISYARSGTVNAGAVYFSANIPTDPGDVDAQAAAFFATNFRARSLFIRDIGDNLRGGLDSNAIMVIYATTPISNCGQNRARPMIVSALANILTGANGYVQLVDAYGPIPGVVMLVLNRTSYTWPAGELGYAVPRAGSCIIDAYTTCCAGPGIPSAPVIAPPFGSYPAPLTVTITAGGGATIYYTTDGSVPTTASPVYAGPFVLTTTTLVQAVAQIGGGPLSNIAQTFYAITSTAETPVIAPAAGPVPSGQVITITDATAGAVIHYTTDGSTPTAASPVYTGTFTISATTTVKAIAIAPGFNDSAVATAAYTVSSINAAAINALVFNAGSQVQAIALMGTSLVIGGDFTSVTDAGGAHARSRICAIDVTTGLVTAFNPGANGPVSVLVIDPNGLLWVGGSFSTLGGVARGNLGRFSALLVLDSFNGLADSPINAIAFNSGNALIGGGFTTFLGSARGSLASVNLTTDTLNAAFSAITGAVDAITFIGTDMYVTGPTNYGGTGRGGGFNLTGGTTLGTWNPLIAGGAAFAACIVTDGTTLFLGGQFFSLRGTGRNYLGAMSPANALAAWLPDPNNQIGQANAMIIVGASVYVAGAFTTVNGGTAQRLVAQFNKVTGTRVAWGPAIAAGTPGNCMYYDLTLNMIFMGGFFNGNNLRVVAP